MGNIASPRTQVLQALQTYFVQCENDKEVEKKKFSSRAGNRNF